ncbi:MAG: hypothetical protein EHM24_11190 [Acidobacteria bacterium]|nr:MAG: hypothetical protein EHM24_11190 [Acidobacteriota bacterium]
MTTCADCGRTILLHRPGATDGMRWAHQVGRAWVYTCRTSFVDRRLVAADYHHPRGEEQRHFVARPRAGAQ